MTRFRCWVERGTAAAVLLVTLFGAAGVAPAACRGETPEVVLTCFTESHAERDVTMLDELLAPEYVWVVVSPPETEVFSRERSLTAAESMFADPGLEWVSLEFYDGYRVVPGKEAETWRIEDLRVALTIKRATAPEADVAPMCATLYVRKVAGEDSAYEVYREVFFDGLGCDGP